MLDPRYFQEDVSILVESLKKRNADSALISKITDLSQKRRQLIRDVESLKSQRNLVSQEIAQLKSNAKTDPSLAKKSEQKIEDMRKVGDQIKALDEELKQVEESVYDLSLRIPNILHASVPEGADSESNQEIRKWGTIEKKSFQPKEHVEIGEALGILDFQRASKISGSRFALYFGAGAALERALIQMMLDLHTRQGHYVEVIPPFLVSRTAMTGTGQLPKFEEDLFKTGLADRELFLIPTSEVPITNIYREEILGSGMLPKYFTAYSPCFRSEAGSYGKDTRGLIRQHQFQKVELVKFVEPEKSYEELEKMTADSEKVLQLLGLPYRVMALCAGDTGFGAAKTYDLEVWLPGQNSYREISSCSNYEDFQARRAQIRYKSDTQSKPKFLHTLNGSALAVGRTLIAILENYQDVEGNVKIPKVLNPYLKGCPYFSEDGDLLWIRKK